MGSTAYMRSQLATRKAVPQSVLALQSRAVRELLVSKWRLQRMEIRRLLLQVLSSELKAYPHAEQTSAVEQALALQSFCSELVDYVCTGHFEIYGRILPVHERANAAVLQHIFDSIGKSTDAVLGFNDHYQQGECARAGTAFRQMLLRLSRGLLLRFALEEQLLEMCGH